MTDQSSEAPDTRQIQILQTAGRPIASTAGMGIGTVYRIIGSKDELLMSIMVAFGHKVGGGWNEVRVRPAGETGRVEFAQYQCPGPVPG